MSSPRRLAPLAVVAVAATTLVLSGCTVTTPAPSVTVTATPAAATPSPTAPSASAPAKPAPPAANPPCTRDDVKTTYAATDGSAGHAHGILTFTSIVAAPCELTGYPTVWFDNPEGQSPMGAPAGKDTSSGTVPDFTLQPGASATAAVTITDAGLVAGCTPVTAIAFLVIPPIPGGPPADTEMLVQHVVIPATPACANSAIGLITVGPMNPA